MKKCIISLILLILSSIGCTPSKFPATTSNAQKIHKYVHIDPLFGSIERQIIINALKEWEVATNYMIVWTVSDWPDSSEHPEDIFKDSDNKHLMIYRSLSIDPEIIDIETKEGHGIAGYAFHYKHSQVEYILLIVDKLANERSFRIVTLHEIGHNLGLPHSEEYGTLMHAKKLYHASGITSSDLNDLWKIWPRL